MMKLTRAYMPMENALHIPTDVAQSFLGHGEMMGHDGQPLPRPDGYLVTGLTPVFRRIDHALKWSPDQAIAGVTLPPIPNLLPSTQKSNMGPPRPSDSTWFPENAGAGIPLPSITNQNPPEFHFNVAPDAPYANSVSQGTSFMKPSVSPYERHNSVTKDRGIPNAGINMGPQLSYVKNPIEEKSLRAPIPNKQESVKPVAGRWVVRKDGRKSPHPDETVEPEVIKHVTSQDVNIQAKITTSSKAAADEIEGAKSDTNPATEDSMSSETQKAKSIVALIRTEDPEPTHQILDADVATIEKDHMKSDPAEQPLQAGGPGIHEKNTKTKPGHDTSVTNYNMEEEEQAAQKNVPTELRELNLKKEDEQAAQKNVLTELNELNLDRNVKSEGPISNIVSHRPSFLEVALSALEKERRVIDSRKPILKEDKPDATGVRSAGRDTFTEKLSAAKRKQKDRAKQAKHLQDYANPTPPRKGEPSGFAQAIEIPSPEEVAQGWQVAKTRKLKKGIDPARSYNNLVEILNEPPPPSEIVSNDILLQNHQDSKDLVHSHDSSISHKTNSLQSITGKAQENTVLASEELQAKDEDGLPIPQTDSNTKEEVLPIPPDNLAQKSTEKLTKAKKKTKPVVGNAKDDDLELTLDNNSKSVLSPKIKKKIKSVMFNMLRKDDPTPFVKITLNREAYSKLYEGHVEDAKAVHEVIMNTCMKELFGKVGVAEGNRRYAALQEQLDQQFTIENLHKIISSDLDSMSERVKELAKLLQVDEEWTVFYKSNNWELVQEKLFQLNDEELKQLRQFLVGDDQLFQRLATIYTMQQENRRGNGKFFTEEELKSLMQQGINIPVLTGLINLLELKSTREFTEEFEKAELYRKALGVTNLMSGTLRASQTVYELDKINWLDSPVRMFILKEPNLEFPNLKRMFNDRLRALASALKDKTLTYAQWMAQVPPTITVKVPENEKISLAEGLLAAHFGITIDHLTSLKVQIREQEYLKALLADGKKTKTKQTGKKYDIEPQYDHQTIVQYPELRNKRRIHWPPRATEELSYFKHHKEYYSFLGYELIPPKGLSKMLKSK